jgi:hypothetical protein
MYEHYSPAIIPISCNPFDYPHKFFKKFYKTLVKRLTAGILPVLVDAQTDVQIVDWPTSDTANMLEISTSHQHPPNKKIP